MPLLLIPLLVPLIGGAALGTAGGLVVVDGARSLAADAALLAIGAYVAYTVIK